MNMNIKYIQVYCTNFADNSRSCQRGVECPECLTSNKAFHLGKDLDNEPDPGIFNSEQRRRSWELGVLKHDRRENM